MRWVVASFLGAVGLTACEQATGDAACPPGGGVGCATDLVEPVVVADDPFKADPVTLARIEALDDAALAEAVAAAWAAAGCRVVTGQGEATAATYRAQQDALADVLGLTAAQRSGSPNEELLDWALEDGEAVLEASGRIVEDDTGWRLEPCAS